MANSAFDSIVIPFMKWYHIQMSEVIQIDPEIMGGCPTFRGTRVPIQTLFDYVEGGDTLDEFLDDFDTVLKEQAVAVLEIAGKVVSSKDIEKLYATAA